MCNHLILLLCSSCILFWCPQKIPRRPHKFDGISQCYITIQFSHKWILSLRRSVTSPVLPYKVWFSTQKWKRRTRPPPSMKTPATLLRTAPARQKFVQRAINHHMVKILEPPLNVQKKSVLYLYSCLSDVVWMRL